MRSYRPVRALERGLSVMEHLSSEGPATPRAISEGIRIDRGTVYRLLSTLSEAGYVEPASGGRYRITARVCGIASGFRIEDVLLSAIGPVLQDLQDAVIWPASYSALRDDVMVVEESTLAISPYAIHSLKPGTSLSILRTSVGRAVLASMPRERRRALSLRLIEREGQSAHQAYSERRIEEMVRRTRAAGYAHNVGDFDPKMSGLALPLIHEGMPIGAVGIMFFTKGLSIRAAAERFLPALRTCVSRLGEALDRERMRAGAECLGARPN